LGGYVNGKSRHHKGVNLSSFLCLFSVDKERKNDKNILSKHQQLILNGNSGNQ